jgi:hypothetical protein
MNESDFLTEEEKQDQIKLGLLSAQVERGLLFEDWLRSAPGLMFSQMLEAQISDAKNAWLAAADRDKAEMVRIQSQVYLKIKQWIASQIQAGKVAKVGLQQFSEEGTVLSNMIRKPERPE